MSDETESLHDRQLKDGQVDEALVQFRSQVREWSEREFEVRRMGSPVTEVFKGRSVWVSLRRAVLTPVTAYALAAVLLATGVGVPLEVRHERQVLAAQEAARVERLRVAEEQATRQAELAVNDDELLRHVDSDIAQDAPDALQPLASLMSNGN